MKTLIFPLVREARLSSVVLMATLLFTSQPLHAETGETPKESSKDVTRVAVVFSGGHDTMPVDHGRPVVLIAAGLGVAPEIFREAFSHVHPAGPGRGPTDVEAKENKAALMNALGKYGITDERLNTVSNFYRYPPGSSTLWKNQSATANALVKEGVVIGYEITSSGAGYSSVPAVTVPGIKDAAAKVVVSYGKDLEHNGAVTAITVGK